MVEFEESEAQLRPAEKDAALFKKICQDIRQLFSEIADLKSKDTEEVRVDLNYNIIVVIIILSFGSYFHRNYFYKHKLFSG